VPGKDTLLGRKPIRLKMQNIFQEFPFGFIAITDIHPRRFENISRLKLLLVGYCSKRSAAKISVKVK